MLDDEDGGELPEDLTVRGNLVASGGEVDFDYSVGVLSVEASGSSIAVIAVAEVEAEVLVAVPQEAWNKRVAKRLLPAGCLRKVVKVVVPISQSPDRSAAAGEPSLPIWLGILSKEQETNVAYDQVPETNFPDLPFAGALVAVAGDHFTFFTAESEAARSSQMEERFAALEKQLAQVAQAVSGKGGLGPTVMPTQPKSAAKKTNARPTMSPELPPGLDPGVAQQALQAGVSRDALEEMAGLMAAPRPGVLRPPAESREQHVRFVDDEEEDFPEAQDVAGGAGDPISTAVVQMSRILSQMHMEKQKAKDKTLEGILDYAESGSGSATATSSSSRSKAAALRSLQRMLVEKPQLIYLEIERAMQQDWERSGRLPGTSAGGVTARGWLEHRSKIQNFPSTVRTAWMIAGILDALRMDRPAEARARCCVALAAMDQQAVDKGSWLLANEVSLEAPPPFHSFALHRAPEVWEPPHSLLIDPRWCELFMAKLRDISDFQEKKTKLVQYQARPGQPEPYVPKVEPNPKKSPKGKGKTGSKDKDADKGAAPAEGQT